MGRGVVRCMSEGVGWGVGVRKGWGEMRCRSEEGEG